MLPVIQLAIFAAAKCGLASDACPGSPVSKHAACSVTVSFPNVTCSVVQTEIEARVARVYDRKSHPGKYALLDTEAGACTKASRTTGDGAKPGPYTDLVGFDFADVPGTSSPTCHMIACSESQVQSLCDYSTNFCNMFNLFCSAADGCTPVSVDIGASASMATSNCDHTATCGGIEDDKSQCAR